MTKPKLYESIKALHENLDLFIEIAEGTGDRDCTGGDMEKAARFLAHCRYDDNMTGEMMGLLDCLVFNLRKELEEND